MEFLGDYDNIERGEDSVFSTAVVMNALIDIWTISGHGSPELQWVPETPQNIIDVVQLAKNFIFENTEELENNGKLLNAFFSGSVKSMNTLPCFYPANVHHYYNGTEFDPNTEMP